MITTRNINVNLDKGKLKLRHITTRDIDAGIRVEPPKVPIKTKSITTTTLADVADIAEKKRRDDIMAEKKLAMKDEKKIAQKGELIVKEKLGKTDEEFAREAGAKFVSTNIPIGHKIEKEKKLKKDEQGGYVKEPDKIIENLKIKCVSGIFEPDEKKPWKEMTDAEKKIAIKERTAKMMATKARKKKEGLK